MEGVPSQMISIKKLENKFNHIKSTLNQICDFVHLRGQISICCLPGLVAPLSIPVGVVLDRVVFPRLRVAEVNQDKRAFFGMPMGNIWF